MAAGKARLLGLQLFQVHDVGAAGGAEDETGSHVRFLEEGKDRLRLISREKSNNQSRCRRFLHLKKQSA